MLKIIVLLIFVTLGYFSFLTIFLQYLDNIFDLYICNEHLKTFFLCQAYIYRDVSVFSTIWH